jgi:hypothetical protein
MSGVFISSQAIDRNPARTLIEVLRSLGLPLEVSPRNPLDGPDARWVDWYSTGLASALRAVDVAVLVLGEGWDSASWMAEEARVAFALLNPECVLFWNPNDVQVRAAGMLPYLKTRLPDTIPDAVAHLCSLVEK